MADVEMRLGGIKPYSGGVHMDINASQICEHLPKDVYGQFLRKYIEYTAHTGNKSEAPSRLFFLLYFLVITFVVSLQLGLLIIVSVNLGEHEILASGSTVVLRPVVLLVVFLSILTGDLNNAAILFRVLDVMLDCGVPGVPRTDGPATLRSFVPLLVTGSLGAFQYALGLAVFWLSALVIGAAADCVTTVSNALIITFVLQLGDYFKSYLVSQVVHERLMALAKLASLRHALVVALLSYAIVVLLFPLILSGMLAVLWLLSTALFILLIVSSRDRKRPFRPALNFTMYYALLPTILYGVCAFRLPGVVASIPAICVVVITVLFIHGICIMLPVLRHVPASLDNHMGCCSGGCHWAFWRQQA